jgi:hypothetical protein
LVTENNKNKWWLRKPVIVATHKKPDEDTIVAVALLRMAGVHIEGYWFRGEGDETLPPQIQPKNVIWVDRGRRVFDHHGLPGKTSVYIVAEELGIGNEKWMKPIIGHVHRSDLQGRSEPFDLGDMTKAISRELNDDLKIMELGIEIATSIILFHKEGKKRENAKAAMIIREFFGDEIKMPEKIRHYFGLLQNPNFVRACDFAELATMNPGLAKEVLKFLVADIEKYQRAMEEIKIAKKIEISKGYFIIVSESNNPKFNVAARQIGAAIVIQRNTTGHTQVYFNNKILGTQVEKIAEGLIEALRLREISLDPSKKLPWIKSSLRSTGKIEEVPEWYFFKGEKGGCLILNGSLTAPEVPVTRIPIEEIAEFAVDVLQNALQQNKWGHGAARRGTPPQKPRREGFGDKALGHQ